jgi:site-specific DNA recombinase
MKDIFGYSRVSSAEQEDTSGFPRQKESCRDAAQQLGLHVLRQYEEDIRGKVPIDERPVMLKLLDDAARLDIDTLMFENRRGLARDEYAALAGVRTLQRSGLTVLYADGSAAPVEGDNPTVFAQDTMLHMMTAWERREIVRRLSAGRRLKDEKYPGNRSQGGRLPFGYRRTTSPPKPVSGLIEVDPTTARIVRWIYEQRAAGWSIGRIASWTETPPKTVSAVLCREEYKQSGPLRIIEPRIWNRVQGINARSRNVNRSYDGYMNSTPLASN